MIGILSTVITYSEVKFSCVDTFIFNKGIVDFFLIDTTPFILHYWNNTKFDWRGVAPRDSYIANLLKVRIIYQVNYICLNYMEKMMAHVVYL